MSDAASSAAAIAIVGGMAAGGGGAVAAKALPLRKCKKCGVVLGNEDKFHCGACGTVRARRGGCARERAGARGRPAARGRLARACVCGAGVRGGEWRARARARARRTVLAHLNSGI